MKSLFLLLGKALNLTLFLTVLGACAPSSEALKPIAEQNQQNIQALSTNLQALTNLYEPLLKASGTALLFQHIGKTQQQMIIVVGAPIFPPAANKTWDDLFVESASKNKLYNELYQLSKLASLQDEDVVAKTRVKAGWIYTAANDPQFTPQVAHDLLKQMRQARKDAPNNALAYKALSKLLAPYDPKMTHYYNAINGSLNLYKGLQEEISAQLQLAATHAKAVNDFVDVKVSQEAVLNNLPKEEFVALLDKLAQKHLEDVDPTIREAVLNFLLGQKI